jgi:hypothetical protein
MSDCKQPNWLFHTKLEKKLKGEETNINCGPGNTTQLGIYLILIIHSHIVNEAHRS